MTKLIQFIKNKTYLNLSDSKRLMASMVIISGLSSFTAIGAPITLADENIDNGNAFLSAQNLTTNESDNNNLFLQNNFFIASGNYIARINVSSAAPRTRGKVVIVTAYSSTPDQTDSSPFITANGTFVHDGIVAANFLPFGAKIRFPEYSGDKIFTVADRMAKKHNDKIDIWMTSRGAAINFGVKKLAYEVVE